jgi:hypothetical protein
MWAHSVIFIQLPKANNPPLGENSPNLVTLARSETPLSPVARVPNGDKLINIREEVEARRGSRIMASTDSADLPKIGENTNNKIITMAPGQEVEKTGKGD